ncbi:MAG: thioredoxin fold domain-containing protein [Burkholderiaceae bacterium]
MPLELGNRGTRERLMRLNRRQALQMAAAAALSAGVGVANAQQPAKASKITASGAAAVPPGMDVKAMYEQFAEKGKGFDMKPGIDGRPVAYVAFDAQCPYCVQLWEAAKPLADKVKFVWLPVAILNTNSEPQGAAILSAPDPAAMMERHEAAFKNPHRGLVTEDMVIPLAAREDVWSNSRIFRRTGGRSVPWGVFKNAKGELRLIPDALKTEDLKKILDVN